MSNSDLQKRSGSCLFYIQKVDVAKQQMVFERKVANELNCSSKGYADHVHGLRGDGKSFVIIYQGIKPSSPSERRTSRGGKVRRPYKMTILDLSYETPHLNLSSFFAEHGTRGQLNGTKNSR